MKPIKEDIDLYHILNTIDHHTKFSESGQLTTKELENESKKFMSLGQFYKKFKIAKDRQFVSSETNEEHKVVWRLTNKGRKFTNDFVEKVLMPNFDRELKE